MCAGFICGDQHRRLILSNQRLISFPGNRTIHRKLTQNQKHYGQDQSQARQKGRQEEIVSVPRAAFHPLRRV